MIVIPGLVDRFNLLTKGRLFRGGTADFFSVSVEGVKLTIIPIAIGEPFKILVLIEKPGMSFDRMLVSLTTLKKGEGISADPVVTDVKQRDLSGGACTFEDLDPDPNKLYGVMLHEPV